MGFVPAGPGSTRESTVGSRVAAVVVYTRARPNTHAHEQMSCTFASFALCCPAYPQSKIAGYPACLVRYKCVYVSGKIHIYVDYICTHLCRQGRTAGGR